MHTASPTTFQPPSTGRVPQPVRRWLPWTQGLVCGLDALRPAAALAARLAMAQVFFWVGLTKLRDWGTTLDLFAHEYQVPLLPSPVAAVLGTGAELVLPVLLVLGLGGRLACQGTRRTFWKCAASTFWAQAVRPSPCSARSAPIAPSACTVWACRWALPQAWTIGI